MTTVGTALYQRILAFDYNDPTRADLMEKVWSVTPWVVNVITGSIEIANYREITQWCRSEFGSEAWPIHGREGAWQTGGATILGETFIGFRTSEDLARFEARYGDRIIGGRE